jgi:Protein of unknown function (DUF3309)
MLLILFLIVLLILAIGSYPTWPYSTNWGYYPSSTLTVILIVILIVWLIRGRV